jgi:hypothetical protein
LIRLKAGERCFARYRADLWGGETAPARSKDVPLPA